MRTTADERKRFERVEVGSIVIRCFEYDRMFAFWQAALGYEIEHRDPSGGFVILRDPDGRGPSISIDQAPARRSGKRGWLHLDLYTTNQELEVQRLVGLGATRYPWRYGADADYVVLEDPDGNLFCVVEVSHEYGAIARRVPEPIHHLEARCDRRDRSGHRRGSPGVCSTRGL